MAANQIEQAIKQLIGWARLTQAYGGAFFVALRISRTRSIASARSAATWSALGSY